jgi:hypothetical protein
MPTAPLQRCVARVGAGRCPNRQAASRCPAHEAVAPRNHFGIRRQARGHGAPYDRARAALTGQLCALRLAGCTSFSTSADYTRPGDWTSPLQPACRHCQRVQGAQLAAAAR